VLYLVFVLQSLSWFVLKPHFMLSFFSLLNLSKCWRFYQNPSICNKFIELGYSCEIVFYFYFVLLWYRFQGEKLCNLKWMEKLRMRHWTPKLILKVVYSVSASVFGNIFFNKSIFIFCKKYCTKKGYFFLIPYFLLKLFPFLKLSLHAQLIIRKVLYSLMIIK
jgi:hypothetical protein